MRPPVNGWAFLYARVACGVAGVPGAVWPGRGAGLLDVPVGGGPPARRPRRELRSARRLEARPGLAPSTGTAAWPSGPSGAHHASGAWWLIGGWARRLVVRPGPSAVSEISHVIPSRLFQILNLDRWNCNVFRVC